MVDYPKGAVARVLDRCMKNNSCPDRFEAIQQLDLPMFDRGMEVIIGLC